MKRILCALLALILLLPGCVPGEKAPQDPMTFYYLRDEVSYGAADGVITAESVDAAGHTGDLDYLLALYLAGPLSDHLCNPFPEDVKLAGVSADSGVLTVTLKGSFGSMEDLAVTKACVCLAMTGFGMTDADTVSLCLVDFRENTTQTVSIPRDSVILEDIIPETT